MLTIKEISWGNCFSYGDKNSIKLDENNITQLIGENGSGKSSIALIIQEALFNKNSKGIKKADIPNRLLSDKYWIKLNFDYNLKQYEINLDRKSTLKVKLIEDGADISSHTATDTFKTIEKILGIDFKVFVQLMYQSTTDGLSFLTATDTNRKKFLIDLFGLNEYEEYHELFKSLVQSTTQKVNQTTGSIDAITNWIRKNENQSNFMDQIELPEPPTDNAELWALKDKASRIKEINRKINDNNKLKELLEQITWDEDIVKLQKQDPAEQNGRVGEINAELKALGTLVTKIESLGDKCPTCEQEINKELQASLVKEAKDKAVALKAERTTVQEIIQQINELNKRISDNKTKKQEWEAIYAKIDRSLSRNIEDINDILDTITELEQKIALEKQKYDKALKDSTNIEKHNARIKLILEQLEEHRADLEKSQINLRALSNELSLVEILKKAFSTNGLVAYKLENLVKDLEQLTNVYLAELSDGRFTLLFSIVSDKLNVKLTDSGNDIDVTALSSGELARVNTATLLAIRKLMNSISKTQINILFLDEVINVLDEYGRDRLVEVLLQEEGLNTFLVSHSWSHPLLNKVHIQKVDGISSIKK